MTHFMDPLFEAAKLLWHDVNREHMDGMIPFFGDHHHDNSTTTTTTRTPPTSTVPSSDLENSVPRGTTTPAMKTTMMMAVEPQPQPPQVHPCKDTGDDDLWHTVQVFHSPHDGIIARRGTSPRKDNAGDPLFLETERYHAKHDNNMHTATIMTPLRKDNAGDPLYMETTRYHTEHEEDCDDHHYPLPHHHRNYNNNNNNNNKNNNTLQDGSSSNEQDDLQTEARKYHVMYTI